MERLSTTLQYYYKDNHKFRPWLIAMLIVPLVMVPALASIITLTNHMADRIGWAPAFFLNIIMMLLAIWVNRHIISVFPTHSLILKYEFKTFGGMLTIIIAAAVNFFIAQALYSMWIETLKNPDPFIAAPYAIVTYAMCVLIPASVMNMHTIPYDVMRRLEEIREVAQKNQEDNKMRVSLRQAVARCHEFLAYDQISSEDALRFFSKMYSLLGTAWDQTYRSAFEIITRRRATRHLLAPPKKD